MRSGSNEPVLALLARRCGSLRRRSLLGVLLAALSCGLALSDAPPGAQMNVEEPLLPEAISERNIELRGRYARQWRQDEKTLVAMFTGGFRLDMGERRLSAGAAVVWITPGVSDPSGRKFYDLTVYLSENAIVQEFGGTTIEDQVLLVSNLRTYGQIISFQDAHATESGEESPLYQQALRDRAAIEAGLPPASQPAPAPPVAVARPAETQPTAERPPPRIIRYYVPNIDPAQTADGEPVFVARRSGAQRVYFARDGGPKSPMLEIQADNAVVFAGESFPRGVLGRGVGGKTGEAAAPEGSPETQPAAAEPGAPSKPRATALTPRGLSQEVRAVYLEGDVVLSLGTSFIRASRLYYDFERDRALILDAVFRADIPERNVPLYVRADEIRQLSAIKFSADHARLSTSEFYTPHYHVGAEHINITDLTKRDTAGRASGVVTGEYEMYNATGNVGGMPISWWPYSKGRYEASETGLRRFRIGYSGDFGSELETRWQLFNLLGIPQPEGYDATWRLDYFSKRGPATGVDVDYKRDDYYGLWRSYYIHDDGEDSLGPLRRNEEIPDTKDRGRVLWRHRHYLPDNWELTFELAYISDANLLEEYERREFNEGKQQETLVYLKRAGEVDALTLLANWRTLDFLTQTEHLPDLTYRRIGDLLGPFALYHESRVGDVRYRLDDRHLFEERSFSNEGETDMTFRTDARQEAELPLKLGAFNLVPFGTVRGSFWDGSPLREGSLWRGLGVYGARGSTTFSRVFDEIESELFDIHRIRHIIKPEFTAWWAHSNARSELITPFDYGIETIDDFYGGSFGVRQTWQTRRGGQEHARTVDLVAFNLEAGAFGDTDGRHDMSNGWVDPLRPENSRSRNYVAGDVTWRLSDTTSLLYDFNYDLNDKQSDRQDISIAVERLPRLAYIFGYRYAGDIDMNLVGGGWNYKLNEKHITTVRGWFDADRGDLGQISLGYVRRLPRWYVGISIDYDRIDDDLSISLSLWPEGIPEWTVGSRRFTGLSNGTGIRP